MQLCDKAWAVDWLAAQTRNKQLGLQDWRDHAGIIDESGIGRKTDRDGVRRL